MTQALRYGIPTRRRFGRLRGAVARRGVPANALARALRSGRRRDEPELERFLSRLTEGWGDLDTGGTPCPDVDGMLVLERASARTIFLFVGDPHPALVCKVPRESSTIVEREAAALTEAAGTGIAPRFLGIAAGSWVQEGLQGAPLRVEPIDPVLATSLEWPEGLDELGRGLLGLAAASAKPAPVDGKVRSLLERAASSTGLTPPTRERIASALADLERIEIGVLKHSDTSPQNCLFHAGRLSGIVDWEMAELDGLPASDVLNAAVSYLEHGIGLSGWSEDDIVESFRAGWGRSPFFGHARAAARAAASAAGVEESMAPSLEVAFFARRLGRRLVSPDRFPTGPRTAARILEIVCGS